MNLQLMKFTVPKIKLKKNNKKHIKNSSQLKPSATVLGPKGSRIENKVLLSEYALALKSFVEKNKRYPRLAKRLRQSGMVKIKLNVSADGKFSRIELISPSQFSALNKGTIKFLQELGSFMPLPKGFSGSREFIIPIVYRLAGGY